MFKKKAEDIITYESTDLFGGKRVTTLNEELKNIKSRFEQITKVQKAILEHLNLEYFEEEKKESGLREVKNYWSHSYVNMMSGGIDVLCKYDVDSKRKSKPKPKKRGRPAGSKNKKK